MTRTDAVKAAGRAIADGLALRDALPPRQAAELAWTPSGPSVEELEMEIRRLRGEATEVSAPVIVEQEAA
jgi:hypothetical protein